jgi:hypothetical protein
MKIYSPGDKLWFLVNEVNRTNWMRGSRRRSLIVSVVVLEVTLYYNGAHRNISEEKDVVMVQNGKHNENGWPMYDEHPASYVSGKEPLTQFVWIDEPVGHAIEVDNPCDGLFSTLEAAQSYALPSRKKHLKRRLKRYRNRHYRSIVKSWAKNKWQHPGFTKLPEKKIYVTR